MQWLSQEDFLRRTMRQHSHLLHAKSSHHRFPTKAGLQVAQDLFNTLGEDSEMLSDLHTAHHCVTPRQKARKKIPSF